MSTDHPVHPALVHFPIAFFTLSWSLDLLYAATTKLQLPILVRNLSPSLPDLTRGAHYMQALGIVTAIPTVMSGGQQLMRMINHGGLYEADGKTIRPKVRLTLMHAVVSDAVVFASIYSWWIRRGGGGGGDATGLLVPSDLNLLMSAVLMPALFFTANLGGTLTYNYGVGISLAKKTKSK